LFIYTTAKRIKRNKIKEDNVMSISIKNYTTQTGFYKTRTKDGKQPGTTNLNNHPYENTDPDIMEISTEAKTAWAAVKADKEAEYENDSDKLDEKIREFINSKVSQTNENDDTAAAEGRRKLTAMKIAMRIARGDNVPEQDHRFLAEYDSALYKAALRASLTADNDDPETHDSLADELVAYETALNELQTQELSDSAEASSDVDDITQTKQDGEY
jgi:hypothetical protein